MAGHPYNDYYNSLILADTSIICIGSNADTSVNQTVSFDEWTMDGDLLQRKLYFNDSIDYLTVYPKGIVKSGSSIYACFGENSNGYISPKFVKLNFNGDTILTANYNFNKDVSAYVGKLHVDSTLLFAGYVIDTIGATTDANIFLFNTDTMGNLLWYNSYGGYMSDYALSIEIADDSGIVICGAATYSPNIYTESYVLKLDMQGNFQWDKQFGGDGNDIARLNKLSNGNMVVYGRIDSTQGLADSYIRISEINNNGDFIWDTVFTFSENLHNSVNGFIETVDGYVFVGQSYFGPASRALILKLDTLGQFIWHRIYTKSTDDNQFTDIIMDDNDGFYVAGIVYGDTAPFYQDSWLLHLNCLGYDTLPRSRIKVSSDTTLAGESFQILNQSKYAEEYLIEYGDGTSELFVSDPNLEDPSQISINHVYTDTGQFVICLRAIACMDTTISYDTVYVLPPDVVLPPQSLVLYPNPGKDMITILDETALINSIYSILFHSSDGSLVEKLNVSGSELLHGIDIYIQSWAAGIYIANVRNNGNSESVSIKFTVIDN